MINKEKKDYFCNFQKLKKLVEVLPKELNGMLDCSYNKLITLEGCSENVNSIFRCSHNKLISLEGGPKFVNGNYVCNFNNLKTLKGCANKINGFLFFEGNQNLTTEQILKEIIEFQIEAKMYVWDNGCLEFRNIKEPFEKYRELNC